MISDIAVIFLAHKTGLRFCVDTSDYIGIDKQINHPGTGRGAGSTPNGYQRQQTFAAFISVDVGTENPELGNLKNPEHTCQR